jgi:hypothetical protein
MGGRRTRRRWEDTRTSDRIKAALALIEVADRQWVGLARWMANTGMDRDPALLDKLALRAEQQSRRERYRAEAMASRRREA